MLSWSVFRHEMRRLGKCLWCCNRGSVALEAALTLLPMLFSLFAVIEMGLYLKCRNDLDLATQLGARQIMVGTTQTQYQTLNADTFKRLYLCPRLPSIFSCDSLVVNATMFDQSIATGAGFYTFVSGTPPTLKVQTTEQTFCLGNGGNYVYLQVAYPLSKLSAGLNVLALLNGGAQSGYLVSSAAFKNEPFANAKYVIPAGC